VPYRWQKNCPVYSANSRLDRNRADRAQEVRIPWQDFHARDKPSLSI
jgi:hypothetical protein